jgi:hypothetical protein
MRQAVQAPIFSGQREIRRSEENAQNKRRQYYSGIREDTRSCHERLAAQEWPIRSYD